MEDAAADRLDDLARAKINLCLHVTGRRDDGRHDLESLAVFPDLGDRMSAEPYPIRALSLDGRFADDLGEDADNLVLKALETLGAALAEPRGAMLRLEKRLPVASGMGGGSADAAATLRLLARLWGRTLDDDALLDLALSLGADVPVCLRSAPALMRGVGEALAPAPAFPEFWLVLVNPGVAVPTGAVFTALKRPDNPPLTARPDAFRNLPEFVSWLARQRNDLEDPARMLAPSIGSALAALARAPEAMLTRMTGSGATCFGMFRSDAQAFAAAEAIRADYPDWWVAHARVKAWAPGGAGDGSEA